MGTKVFRTSSKEARTVCEARRKSRHLHSFARNSRKLLKSELSRECVRVLKKRSR